MYLIAIGWLYVALMMAVAEASASNGSILGAVFTFLLYGLAPTALVMYLLGTPARKRALKAQEAALAAQAAQAGQTGAPASAQPDAGRDAAADAVAPVRKEP
jgi:mannose/fructose/N-acetylgalactosamine-specific phosphotransferase system component IID